MKALSALAGYALLSSVLVGTTTAQTLRPQWTQDPATGRWYGALVPATSWSATRQWAHLHGAAMVSIGSAAENQAVSTAFSFFAPQGVWIGLTDSDIEGSWGWDDSQALVWTGWASGEPALANAALKDAAYANAGMWISDAPSTNTRLGLVEQASRPGRGYTLPKLLDTAPNMSTADCAIGDIDGDGHQDVVVVHDAISTLDAPILCYLRPNGALPNTAIASVTGWNGSGTRVSLADVDGDGDLDASLTNSTHQYVDVRAGDGTGHFAPLIVISAGEALKQSAWIDIDGDLDLDLVALSNSRVLVWRRVQGLSFAQPTLLVPSAFTQWMEVADMDGDSRPEILTGSSSVSRVEIFPNDGNGNFGSPTAVITGGPTGRAAVGDWNNDGATDLAVPTASPARVEVYLRGTNGLALHALFAAPIAPAACVAADLDNDGWKDIAVSSPTSGVGMVFENGGSATFARSQTLLVGPSAGRFVTGDLNGDQRTDLATTLGTARKVALVLALGGDCDANGVDDVLELAAGDCDANDTLDRCEPWRDCNSNGLLDTCELVTQPGLDADLDGQLDACQPLGSPQCFGDGTGVACPCDPGQTGNPGTGCRNSLGRSGQLSATGAALLSADTVTLRVDGVPPSATGLYFQGDAAQNGGQGAPFGDGLLCVNTAVRRLGIRQAQQGVSRLGFRTGVDQPLHTLGAVPTAGATRWYQVWYRDAAVYCTASTFNLTNGLRILWRP